MTKKEDILYTWKFEDKKNRGAMWYIIALSIVIGLSIWGFLTKQYGMSFIILLISGLSFFIENNSDDEVEIYITTLGIKIGNSFYDFPKIISYSFIYDGENAIFLKLNLNKKGIKTINLKVNNEITQDTKTILSEFIKENPKGKLSFSEKIISLLKL